MHKSGWSRGDSAMVLIRLKDRLATPTQEILTPYSLLLNYGSVTFKLPLMCHHNPFFSPPSIQWQYNNMPKIGQYWWLAIYIDKYCSYLGQSGQHEITLPFKSAFLCLSVRPSVHEPKMVQYMGSPGWLVMQEFFLHNRDVKSKKFSQWILCFWTCLQLFVTHDLDLSPGFQNGTIHGVFRLTSGVMLKLPPNRPSLPLNYP